MVTQTDTATTPETGRTSAGWKWWLIALAILAVAAVLRFWDISSRPGYDWDEGVYTSILTNMANHNELLLKPQSGAYDPGPYLFHPPFYFIIVGAWMKLVGTGITQARVWAALMSLIALVLIARALRPFVGRVWSLVGMAAVAIDGWMIFTNRVSWLENTMMVLVLGGFLLYCRAITSGKLKDFALAGLVLGGAGIFKHVGLYVTLAVVIHWALRRGQKREHLLLLAVIASVFVVYLAGMTVAFTRGGHSWYWEDTLVQIQRALGIRSSRGSITSSSDLIGPLFAQYRIFAGTILASSASIVILVVRTVQMIVQRSIKPVAAILPLYAWAITSTAIFIVLPLRFPHYFIMVLTPLYMYLMAEVARTVPRWRARSHTRTRNGLIALGLAVVILGAGAFGFRIAARDDNALAAVAAYTAANLPPTAVITTEESVAAVIKQPWCAMWRVNQCLGTEQYLITYESFTEQPPNDPLINAIRAQGQKLAVFSGFKETITVFKIPPTLKVVAGQPLVATGVK